ncbi:hypothetical protein [Bdellovibrio sp. HCB2-146]|uniref:hypothetical protein n=1 Tax=Bdellovibrio sp. HCB2-146 TaxID=3394362 RepID=UPI0039BCE48C
MEIVNRFLNFYRNLDKTVTSLEALRLARRLTYLWVFVNYLILGTNAAFFFSESSLIPKKDFFNLSTLEQSLNLLHNGSITAFYPLFLIGVIASSALAFFEIAPRTMALVTYFLAMNLDNKAYVILDGGNNLMHLLLFYLILVNPKASTSAFSNTITNLARLMIQFQVVFVYATAGLLKVMGPLWNKGVALYYTMGVPEYGNEQLFQFLAHFPLVLAALTLGTVLFQISLPYLIWTKTWRPLVVLAGTGLHLSISFVMGLFTFGLAMCVSYYFFFEDDENSMASITVKLFKRLRV